MPIDVAKVFEEHNEEFLKFRRIAPDRRLHARPDIHAFLLLDRLIPGERDMVAWAGHDEIALDPRAEDIAGVATEQDVIDLIRCGVRFDRDNESLCMFV